MGCSPVGRRPTLRERLPMASGRRAVNTAGPERRMAR
jgi:hypothetical protein